MKRMGERSLIVGLWVVLVLKSCDALNCDGCVALDGLSFDKVISKFPASLVKFDIAYPYGERHEHFAQVAKDAANIPDLFTGEVGIKEYGDKENVEFETRFEFNRDDYPMVILFVKNNKEGSIEHFKFKYEFTSENLKKFLKEKAGIRIPLTGCISEFDALTEGFAILSTEKMESALKTAKNLAKDLSEDLSKSGSTYIKLMKKVISDGVGFLDSEENRVNKILTTKLKPAKKLEMETRLNIIKSFVTRPQKKAKEEL
eukprot:TRINITY_DN11994_c0_g1_i9.p1 TRINITY_DN11994_c0_g1~~TRINITY_DN11994_c0_g1_i9.p1  ORF type:complete len:258 (-),score=69.80 TRINITY_DN11994_c0_g1_i9:155-928(-)